MHLFALRYGSATLLLASLCAAQSNNSPAGEWLVVTDLFGTSLQRFYHSFS
jgi:mannose/fructose-specific phosphotransferase system component IIA